MKKIEIIARITEDSGATTENPLMVWHDDGDYEGYPFLSSTLTYPGLEIRLHQRRVLRNGKDVMNTEFWYFWRNDLVGYAAKSKFLKMYGMRIVKALW